MDRVEFKFYPYDDDSFAIDCPLLDLSGVGEIENLFKRLYLKFDSEKKYWISKYSMYYEVLFWFGYYGFSVVSNREILKIVRANHTVSPELKIFDTEFSDSCLSDRVSLFRYQREDIQNMVRRNRNFLFHDPGLGKTLLSIAYFSHLYARKEVDKIFITTELAILSHWRHEILEFSSQFTDSDICIIDNTSVKTLEKYKDKKVFIVAHHIFEDVAMMTANKWSSRVKVRAVNFYGGLK